MVRVHSGLPYRSTTQLAWHCDSIRAMVVVRHDPQKTWCISAAHPLEASVGPRADIWAEICHWLCQACEELGRFGDLTMVEVDTERTQVSQNRRDLGHPAG